MAFLLVVDDDTEVLDAMCAVLTAAGHSVFPAEGGLPALDILDANKQALDLMVTDVVMPGLHGFNLSRMARLRRPEIKVLYISGYTEMPTTVNDTGPKLGKMLQKPILPDDLRREVTEALAAAPTEH
jgi:two-component system, cell cycle response regulator CpdR